MTTPTKAELLKAAEIEEAIARVKPQAPNVHITWPASERAKILRKLAGEVK